MIARLLCRLGIHRRVLSFYGQTYVEHTCRCGHKWRRRWPPV